MFSTFKWTFEGIIPEGKTGDQLLEVADLLTQKFPELHLKLIEFDNKPAQSVINLPVRAELDWMNKLPWI